jgi:hypothetical protein
VAMPERLNESLEARVAAQIGLFGSKAFAKQKGTHVLRLVHLPVCNSGSLHACQQTHTTTAAQCWGTLQRNVSRLFIL